MTFALYILYAFIQAVLTARYVIHEKEQPVFAVVLLTIFAPLTTIGLIGYGFWHSVTWLVTYRGKAQ